MKQVFVVSAVRTPIGNIGGAFKDLLPEVLLSVVLENALTKAGIAKETVDEVVVGQAKQSTDQPNIARVASLMIGIPESVPSYTVHRQCASGMQAMLSGMQQIQLGYSDIVLTGGVESMSTAPFYIRNARFGVGSGNALFIDPNVESQPKSQPHDIYGTFNMINTAENIAEKFNISREECDEFAFQSQQKAIAAIDRGSFKDEVVPVLVPQKKREPICVEIDEFPRRDTNLAKMASLKPVFQGGVTTAGNASGRNDGASALLLMSSEKAEELGCEPIARILAGAAAGVDPRLMGLGPVASTKKLLDCLQNERLKLKDFGLIELNEAFAAQTLGCIKEMDIDRSILNVNGGAIALGHPLGCSGSRISTTLLHEMRKRNVRLGLATLCVAGGLGMSMAFEKI